MHERNTEVVEYKRRNITLVKGQVAPRPPPPKKVECALIIEIVLYLNQTIGHSFGDLDAIFCAP